MYLDYFSSYSDDNEPSSLPTHNKVTSTINVTTHVDTTVQILEKKILAPMHVASPCYKSKID